MKRNQRSMLILIGLGVLVALAGQGCGVQNVSSNVCNSTPSYRVLPGQSVDLRNPCGENGTPTGDAWFSHDWFKPTNPPTGISVTRTVGPDGIPVMKLQAALTVAPLSKDVGYVYEPKSDAPAPKVLVGTLEVKTVPELHVSVIAAPTKLPGQTLLQATPTGGAQPYSFSWTPSNGLDDATSATPLANPAATTTYTVTVTDNVGQTVSASVTVTVSPKSSTFTLTVTNQLFDVFGIMTSTPGGISCPTTCSVSFASGTTVVLLLQGVGPPFWNGCNSVVNSRDPTSGLILSRCTVVMDADKSVFAGI
jgi:hypothetical protein